MNEIHSEFAKLNEEANVLIEIQKNVGGAAIKKG